jgi:hypothetical protein
MDVPRPGSTTVAPTFRTTMLSWKVVSSATVIDVPGEAESVIARGKGDEVDALEQETLMTIAHTRGIIMRA